MEKFCKDEMQETIAKLCLAFGFDYISEESMNILENVSFHFIRKLADSFKSIQETVNYELDPTVLFNLCKANSKDVKDLVTRLLNIDGMVVDDIIAPIPLMSEFDPGSVLPSKVESNDNVNKALPQVKYSNDFKYGSDWLAEQDPVIAKQTTTSFIKARSGCLTSGLLNAVHQEVIPSSDNISSMDKEDKLLDEIQSSPCMSPASYQGKDEIKHVSPVRLIIRSSASTKAIQHKEKSASIKIKNQETKILANTSAECIQTNYSVQATEKEPLKLRIRLENKPLGNTTALPTVVSTLSSEVPTNVLQDIPTEVPIIEAKISPSDSRSRRKQSNPQQVKDELEPHIKQSKISLCTVCKNPVEEVTHRVQCNHCKIYCHWICAKTEKGSISWICQKCQRS